MLEPEKIYKEGWLKKKGEINRGWKQRWFSLTPHAITYYIRQRHRKQGAILISDIFYISENPEEKTELNIFTKGRAFRLKADSVEDKYSWLNAFIRYCGTALAHIVQSEEQGYAFDEDRQVTLVQASAEGAGYSYRPLADSVTVGIDNELEMLEKMFEEGADPVEKEGVIKFQLDFEEGDSVSYSEIEEMNIWRKVTCRMQMIGADPCRYLGYGFGNISQRYPYGDNDDAFIISGTQTGNTEDLDESHYPVVTACFPEENRVTAKGPIKPSSESMTHGMVYMCDPGAQYVVHVHDPFIWTHADKLEIPTTSGDIPYGTPEMSFAVSELFNNTNVKELKIFSMDGHEDGVVAFGSSLEDIISLLLRYLSEAIRFEYEDKYQDKARAIK